ncbi:RNA-directed DNA polymerase from mobile element jockey [Trichonephila clavipes]|nr:RNA-directed DNA polymerase from mobile element jockey [Trichonephila clavipes]
MPNFVKGFGYVPYRVCYCGLKWKDWLVGCGKEAWLLEQYGPRGNRLYRYVVNNGIDVLAPPTPTRFCTASATIIDYALMKNLIWPCTIDSMPELSSDHNPIKLNFPRTPSFKIPPPQLYTNWNVFTNNLANNENLYLPQASSTPEIESQVWEEHLTSLDAEDGSLWGTARAFRKKASPISALNGP